MSEKVEILDKPQGAKVPRCYTYEELVAEMPETNQPCELWDGELLRSPTPSFHHQKVSLRFYVVVQDRKPVHGCCPVFGSLCNPFSMANKWDRGGTLSLPFQQKGRDGLPRPSLLSPWR